MRVISARAATHACAPLPLSGIASSIALRAADEAVGDVRLLGAGDADAGVGHLEGGCWPVVRAASRTVPKPRIPASPAGTTEVYASATRGSGCGTSVMVSSTRAIVFASAESAASRSTCDGSTGDAQ